MTGREALPPRAAEWLLEWALPPAVGREIAQDLWNDADRVSSRDGGASASNSSPVSVAVVVPPVPIARIVFEVADEVRERVTV